ncbi:unnamed protein product [Ectocarpus sp. 4 AP-2014]
MSRTGDLSSVCSINSRTSYCSISSGPPLLDDAEDDTGRATPRVGGFSSEDVRQSLAYSSAAPESDGASTARSGRASQARGSNKRNKGRVNVSRRFQRPLREVVARRAFECVVGTHGELSKVLRITAESDAALKQTRDRCDQDELQQTETETRSSSSETSRQHHDRHGRHSRVDSPGLGCRVEPVLHGEDIDIDHQASSGNFWGVDLHWCDLGSLAGFPAELGGSPWAPPGKGSDKEDEDEDGDEDEDKDESWRFLYLDASLNRLRGIDAIADEASLCDLASTLFNSNPLLTTFFREG